MVTHLCLQTPSFQTDLRPAVILAIPLTGAHWFPGLKSNRRKSWMMGMLFSSHWIWLRTVRRKGLLGEANREWILSATTWTCLTSEEGATEMERKRKEFDAGGKYINKYINKRERREEVQKPHLLVLIEWYKYHILDLDLIYSYIIIIIIMMIIIINNNNNNNTLFSIVQSYKMR